MTSPVTMPQSPEAEQAVLGVILLTEGSILDDVRPLVTAETFWNVAHKKIYRAICDLRDGMRPIDTVTVTNRLKDFGLLDECGGAHYLSKLSGCCPTTAHLTDYCRILSDKYRLRRLIEIGTNALTMAYRGPEDTDEFLRGVSGKVMDLTVSDGTDENLVNAAYQSFLNHMEQAETGKGIGIPTGFPMFDKYLGGWMPRSYTLIAAEAKLGKTALFEQFLLAAIESGHHVTIVQKDTAYQDFFLRLVCRRSDVSYWRASKGRVKGVESRMHEAARWLRGKENMWRLLSPSRMDGSEFRATMAREKKKYGTELILLDHIRSLRHHARDQWEGLTANSMEIRDGCHETGVPVCALNHLNRKGSQEERPHASDIKGCDQYKDDCDTICIMWRIGQPVGEDKISEVGVGFDYNRAGPPGEAKLRFHGRTMTFEEIRPEPKQDNLPLNKD